MLRMAVNKPADPFPGRDAATSRSIVNNQKAALSSHAVPSCDDGEKFTRSMIKEEPLLHQ